MEYLATLGSAGFRDETLQVGDFPHVVRMLPLLAPAATDLPLGHIMAVTGEGAAYPYKESATWVIGVGDGAFKDVSGVLGKLEPGTVVITDGVETFTDNGTGVLTGDQGGSGFVEYSFGKFSLAFNTAPADAAEITATVKNAMKGALATPVKTGDSMVQICVHGTVKRSLLSIAEAEPTKAELNELDSLGVWPIG